MSLGYTPSSVRLEIEARRMHAAAPPRGLADIAPAVALCGFPQAFDLFVGTAAAILVFPAVFFPGLDHSLAIWAGIGLGALGYAVSPLGTVLAKLVRRRYGGGVQLTAARFGLGAATALIGFLPSAASIGWAAVALLAICRLGQGLAMGGAADDGAALRELSSQRHGRFWAAVTRSLAPVFGLAAAAVLFAILRLSLDDEDFLSWGWRYPFLLGMAANIVALFAQLRLFTTDLREPAGDKSELRLASVSERR